MNTSSTNKKNTENKSFYRYALILFMVLIIGISATIFWYYDYYIMDHVEFMSSVTITNATVGINTNTSSLQFGKIPLEGVGTRYFKISSKRRALVRIIPTGNITPFIDFSENDFILDPGVVKTINATLSVPQNATIGNYSGIIKVYFYRK